MTTWTTALKFAPLLTVDRVNDPAWQRADRSMYDGVGALRFLPRQAPVPLLVDHDPDHQIGVVTDLWRLEWLDGPWIAATATLHEPPGDWLTRGRGVSFGSKPYGRRAATFAGPEGQVVTHAFLEEVSVLLALKPREPLAEVVSVRAAKPVAHRRVRSEPPAAAERNHGFPSRAEARWLVAAETEAAKRGNVIRTFGQVLGVR